MIPFRILEVKMSTKITCDVCQKSRVATRSASCSRCSVKWCSKCIDSDALNGKAFNCNHIDCNIIYCKACTVPMNFAKCESCPLHFCTLHRVHDCQPDRLQKLLDDLNNA